MWTKSVCKQTQVTGIKVIRHAEVDSRMIILDNQTCQQMTCHFQLSLHCNLLLITSFVRYTAHVTGMYTGGSN